MMTGFGIGLSGVNAASLRIAVAAGNIANFLSRAASETAGDSGFQPLRVEQTSLAPGGTLALARPVVPAAVPSFEPDSPDADADGIAPRPNVSLERELIELGLAANAYRSGFRLLEAQNRTLGALLDRLG